MEAKEHIQGLATQPLNVRLSFLAVQARKIQRRRFAKRRNLSCNARMGSRELREHAALDEESLELLRHAMQSMNLSARAYDRILKVSRTIADLDGANDIQAAHVAEAIQFRALDRQLWT